MIRLRLPATVWTLCAVSFLTDVSTEMSLVVLPMFLTSTLGASVSFVGLIEGVAETTASLLKVFSGWLSDRLGRRKVLVVAGYSLSAATRPVLAIASSALQVLGARFLDRIGKGLRTSPRDALLAATVADDRRGFVFGLHRAMDHAGAVAGPLITFALISGAVVNYRWVFWIAAIPAALTIPLLVFGVRDETSSAKPAEAKPARGPWHPTGIFLRYICIVFLFTLSNSSDAFLLLRARDLGIAVPHIPLLFAALHVSKMLSSVPGGALSDRFSRKTLVLAGWLLYALVYLGFGLARTPGHVWTLFLVYGLYFGLTEGTERAWVADFVPPEIRGRAYGAFHLAVGIGAFPASLLMGVLWDRFGPTGAFAFGASLAFAAAVALGLWIPDDKRVAHK